MEAGRLCFFSWSREIVISGCVTVDQIKWKMKLKCYFSVLKLLQFLLRRYLGKKLCVICPILSSKLTVALPIFNMCSYLFKRTYLPPQRNLICCHIPELSAPLCRTAGLFISGCFPQTSDWNAARNHRLPPCAPRMLCSAASSLLPSQPPGLFRRQFQTWHCAYGSAGQRRQRSPTPGKFPGLRRCKIH